MKIAKSTLLRYPVGRKFRRNRTVKDIEANLCFAIFGKNSKIQNGHHFREEEKFLNIAKSTFFSYPVGRKFRRNRSHTVKEIVANLCFSIFLAKIRKYKMAAIFGEGKFFFENWQEYISQIPCGSKISTKSFYLARFRR